MRQIDSDFTGDQGNSHLSLAWHGNYHLGWHLHIVTTEGIRQANELNFVF